MQIEFLKKHNNLFIYLSIILFSFVFFYFFNVISPIREEILFHYDISVFYNIGKGMTRGMLPYKDLFDHKGIYTYFLFYIASLISEYNHIGLYIIFSLYFSLIGIFTYKIIHLYIKGLKSNIVYIVSALFSYIYMFNIFTSYGSFAPEHMSYPLILICYYLYLKYRSDLNDNISTYEYRDMFITGIIAGVIMLIKINHLFLLMPIVISETIHCIKEKDYIKLIKFFFCGVTGIFIGIMPAIIYLYKNGIFDEFYKDYVVFNFSYMRSRFILVRRYTGYTESLFEILYKYKYIFLLTFVSIFIICKYHMNINKKNNDESIKYNNDKLLFYLLVIAFTILEIMLMKRSSGYYTSVLLFGVLPIVVYIVNKFYVKNKFINVILVVLLFLVSYFATYKDLYYNNYYVYKNLYNEDYGTDIDPFKTGISEIKEMFGKDDIKLLSISHPHYYLHLDVMPVNRYFYRPIIERRRFKEYYETVEKEVMDLKFDAIILTYAGDVASYFSDEFFDFVNDNYTKLYTNPINQEALLVKNVK